MRTRKILKLKYRSDVRANARFVCNRYCDDTCPHYDDACECPRNDRDDDHSEDNCPDFAKVSMKQYQKTFQWTREELREMV